VSLAACGAEPRVVPEAVQEAETIVVALVVGLDVPLVAGLRESRVS
jgi:hypothetical protein